MHLHRLLAESCQTVKLRQVAEHGTVRKRRERTEEFHPADKTKPNQTDRETKRQKAKALPWRGLIGNLNGLGTIKTRARSGCLGAPLHSHGTALAPGCTHQDSVTWCHLVARLGETT